MLDQTPARSGLRVELAVYGDAQQVTSRKCTIWSAGRFFAASFASEQRRRARREWTLVYPTALSAHTTTTKTPTGGVAPSAAADNGVTGTGVNPPPGKLAGR